LPVWASALGSRRLYADPEPSSSNGCGRPSSSKRGMTRRSPSPTSSSWRIGTASTSPRHCFRESSRDVGESSAPRCRAKSRSLWPSAGSLACFSIGSIGPTAMSTSTAGGEALPLTRPSHRRRSEEQVLSIRALPPRAGEEVLREGGVGPGMGGDGQRRAKASPPEVLLHSRVREGREKSGVQAVFLPGSSAETLGGAASWLRGSWSLQMLTAIA